MALEPLAQIVLSQIANDLGILDTGIRNKGFIHKTVPSGRFALCMLILSSHFGTLD